MSTAGVLMTGAVAAVAGGTAFAKEKSAKDEKASWPAAYAKLDPEAIRVQAYLGYYKAQ